MQKDRYPSINPFLEDQSEIFFGRDAEIQQLKKVIDLNRITVLHAKSGLGKSSLINAGILPTVRENNLTPFDFRLYSYQGVETEFPLDRVKHRLELELEEESSFIDLLTQNQKSIWYYLKRIQIQRPEGKGFLLVFDQLEELFTYPSAEVERLSEELASVLLEGIPQQIMDQFEEHYLEDSKFLTDEQIELLHQPFQVKLLIALRSDRLSLLGSLTKSIPRVMNNIFELCALTRDSAEDAILNPAYLKKKGYASPSFEYSDAALIGILDYLTKRGKEPVESFQLQILCSHIEKNIIPGKKGSRIELEDLGNIDSIYENYYSTQIDKLEDQSEKLAAKRLIEEGLIQEENERRLSLHSAQITRIFHVRQELLDKLVATRIIRPQPDLKGGFIYELSHDSIVNPILKAKNKRLEEEQKAAARLAEERKEWELEAERLKNKKEKQRLAYWRYLMILSFITLLIVSGFFLWARKASIDKKAQEIEIQEQRLAKSVQEKNLRSITLTSNALLVSKVDRTLALNLAKSALEVESSNKLANDVVNELLLNVESFPLYDYIIEEHPNYITGLAISSNQESFATACLDGNIRIWSMNGKMKSIWEEAGENIRDLEWVSPNLLLSAGLDRRVRLWKNDGTKITTFTHKYGVYDAAFNKNRSEVAAVGEGGVLMVWNLKTREVIHVSNPHEGVASSLAIAGNSNLLISGGYDKRIAFTELIQGRKVLELTNIDSEVETLSFELESGILAAGLRNGKVKLWEIVDDTTAQPLLTLKAHLNRISDLQFANRGKNILTVSWDKTAKLWDLHGNLLKTFVGHKDGLRAGEVSSDGLRVITAGEDKAPRIWRVEQLTVKRFPTFTSEVVAVEYGRSTDVWLIGAGHRVFLFKSGKLIKQFDHDRELMDTDLSPDGQIIATVGLGSIIKLWGVNGKIIQTIQGNYNKAFRSVHFSSDGKSLLTSNDLKALQVWDINGKLLETFMVNGGIDEAIYSPNGEFIGIARLDGLVEVRSIDKSWDLTLEGHSDRVSAIAISPDNNLIATGSWDNTIRIWDIKGNLIAELLGHTSDINRVEFSPDGTKLLSASADGTVRLWSPEGKELPSIIQHTMTITDASFSVDGEQILSGSRDKTVKLWSLTKVDEVLEAIPSLGIEELERYESRPQDNVNEKSENDDS